MHRIQSHDPNQIFEEYWDGLGNPKRTSYAGTAVISVVTPQLHSRLLQISCFLYIHDSS